MGLVQAVKSRVALWKFMRTPLAGALRLHTQEFFYSGQALSWMDEKTKQGFIGDLMNHIKEAVQAPDGMVLREKLTEFVLMFAQLAVLALTEEEKKVMEYGKSPYISGELHHHIVEATPHCEELNRIAWEQGGNLTSEELVSVANARASVALFYANALNMLRVETLDSDPVKDWYKPFVEAMMVWEEDNYREKLGLPRLVQGAVGGLTYFSFMNDVLNGERNPFYSWTQAWPGFYLAGEGPSLPQGV